MKTCGAGGSPSLARSITSMRSGSPTWIGGQPDTRRLVHGLEHVAGEPAHGVVDALHRLGNLAQQRIGKDDERLDRHGEPHLRARGRSVNGRSRRVHCFDLHAGRESAMVANMDEVFLLLGEPVAQARRHDNLAGHGARRGRRVLPLAHGRAGGRAVARRAGAHWRPPWMRRTGRARWTHGWPASCRRRRRCRAGSARWPKCSAPAKPS